MPVNYILFTGILNFKTMNLNNYSKVFHRAAKDNGFWDKEPNFAEKLMLVVSELSECLEADRKNHHANLQVYNELSPHERTAANFEIMVKSTVEDEIADAFIRLFDICGYYGIDIEAHIKAKAEYNATRPYKHGKAY